MATPIYSTYTIGDKHFAVVDTERMVWVTLLDSYGDMTAHSKSAHLCHEEAANVVIARLAASILADTII